MLQLIYTPLRPSRRPQACTLKTLELSLSDSKLLNQNPRWPRVIVLSSLTLFATIALLRLEGEHVRNLYL